MSWGLGVPIPLYRRWLRRPWWFFFWVEVQEYKLVSPSFLATLVPRHYLGPIKTLWKQCSYLAGTLQKSNSFANDTPVCPMSHGLEARKPKTAACTLHVFPTPRHQLFGFVCSDERWLLSDLGIFSFEVTSAGLMWMGGR